MQALFFLRKEKRWLVEKMVKKSITKRRALS